MFREFDRSYNVNGHYFRIHFELQAPDYMDMLIQSTGGDCCIRFHSVNGVRAMETVLKDFITFLEMI